MDATAALVETVRTAAAERRLLRIRGGGSKDFYGNAPAGEPLDMGGHAGIVNYEPAELVLTVRGGTPLAAVEAELARNGQCLACEPPQFAGGATIGGAVAAGLSGPARAQVGAVRDFVLGVRLLDGNGRVLRFGGEVMKNVAGYDVSRLIAGSMGTLGAILDVSLKVLPLPAATATLRFETTAEDAVTTMNRWAGQALPMRAAAWCDGLLTLRLAGARAAVAAACGRLGGEAMADEAAAAFWAGLRDQTAEFFAGTAPLWRLALPSAAAPLALPGRQSIEWNGSQRWLRGDRDAAQVRAEAHRLGGHAVLFRHGDKAAGVFDPLPPVLADLNRRVRSALDPAGVFDTRRI